MSEPTKIAASKIDTVTSSRALKRKYEPEMADICTNEPGNGKTTFNDMCDDVIDTILCYLELVDLANVSDTCTRLRGLAASAFSRKYAHHLISINAFRYSHSLRDHTLECLEQGFPVYCQHNSMVRIFDANVWFKLMRNFGESIKHLRIHNSGRTTIVTALQNLIAYVTEYCSESLETLDVDGYEYFTLSKPLPKLQEFCFNNKYGAYSENLGLMPNVRTLRLCHAPKSIAKHYAKLERVDLQLRNDEQANAFISLLRLNRQIKHLHLWIAFKRRPSQNVLIYSSIAENLTQLKTFKLYDPNRHEITSQFHLKTVESFSTSYGHLRFMFQFDNLKKLSLLGPSTALAFSMNFVLRHRKLKILKIRFLHGPFLNDIQHVVKQLPELEQIIVRSHDENTSASLRNLLGIEWEQFEKEKTGRYKPRWTPRYQHFRKIKSTH